MRAHHFTNDIQNVLSVKSLTEDVGGNYLYHATSANGLKGILASGNIGAAGGPQNATRAQTQLPSVSVSREWAYASGEVMASEGVAHAAVLILNRYSIEQRYKTLGTSQSRDIRGLAHSTSDPVLTTKLALLAILNKLKPAHFTTPGGNAHNQYKASKAGGEFEEAVVVPKGTLPLKGILVGFWVNPKSELINDPTVMNDPRRLEKTGPNTFVKADTSPLHSEKPVRTPDEKKAQRVAGQEKSKQMALAKKNVPTPAVAEGLTRDQQFDMIEEMVLYIAEQHNVDADDIWDDFECVDDETLLESAAWQKKAGKNKTGGLNKKGVASYRKEHPGSKLQTAVTTKPSKLKPGSKAAKRRKSFCARMGGMKGPMKDEHGKPTRKALSLRKWNC